MTTTSSDLEDRLAQFVEHHVLRGERLPAERLCEGRPDLVAPLQDLIAQYLSLTASIGGAEEATGGARVPAPSHQDRQGLSGDTNGPN